MTIKKILIEPDPILRKKSTEVKEADREIKTLMDDMLETMYDAPGIGLAAIQIGIAKRVIVIDLSKDQKKNPIFLINPNIISKSEKKSKYEEGCLSIPGQFAEITRPEECTVEFLEYNGNKKQISAKGLLSTCIQHEIDHLNGILFIDYLSKLKKNMILKRLSKQSKKSKRVVI